MNSGKQKDFIKIKGTKRTKTIIAADLQKQFLKSFSVLQIVKLCLFKIGPSEWFTRRKIQLMTSMEFRLIEFSIYFET